MTESIEVYFKNQNDAESAQAQLRTLKVKQIYVEEMPEDAGMTLFVPFFSRNVDSGQAGSGGVGSAAPIFADVTEEDSGPNYPAFLLYVEVDTEDYEEAVSILQEHDSYTREEE